MMVVLLALGSASTARCLRHHLFAGAHAAALGNRALSNRSFGSAGSIAKHRTHVRTRGRESSNLEYREYAARSPEPVQRSGGLDIG